MHTRSDTYTHSIQGVGTEVGWFRWDLHSELASPFGGGTSIQRLDLQLEVGPPIGGGTSNQRWDLQLEVRPPIGGGTPITGGPPIGGLTSNGSTHLWSELPPPIRAPTSDWWLEQTCKVRYTCIHVLMHVHMLTKVWEQRWDHWDTTTVPHRAPRFPYNYLKGVKQTL